MSKLAMTMALDALINVRGMHYTAVIPAEKAITALTAALAEPSAEPYAIAYEYDGPFGMHQSFSYEHRNGKYPDRSFPVYLHPPVHQPLTDEEIMQCFAKAYPDDWLESLEEMQKTDEWVELTALVRAIEQAIRSKT
jgi:hypothetical protein